MKCVHVLTPQRDWKHSFEMILFGQEILYLKWQLSRIGSDYSAHFAKDGNCHNNALIAMFHTLKSQRQFELFELHDFISGRIS